MRTFGAALAAAAVGGAVALPTALLLRARPPGRLRAPNHRGVALPVVLGIALTAGLAAGTAAGLALSGRSGAGSSAGPPAVVLGAVALVALAGMADDLSPGGERGLRGHLRALLAGRVSTGILKVAAIVAASVVALSALPGVTAPTWVLGVPVLAGGANLWNGLDVAPGRALKWFLPLAGAALVAHPGGIAGLTVAGALGAGLVLLPFDLRERAMLGDAGSNALGFVLGIAAVAALPPAALGAAAAGAVALNIVAETVTLSRLIRSVPPLAWYDRLGRPEA
ncbi:MAG: hypothetical protein HY658_07255 [Actinobacteria bacterium]|nr:hypothetical protein [Actinomycetota bacterium]